MSFTAFGRAPEHNGFSSGSNGNHHNGATTDGHPAALNLNGHSHLNGNGHANGNGYANGHGEANGHGHANGNGNGNGHNSGHHTERNGNIAGDAKNGGVGSRFRRVQASVSSDVSIKGTITFRSELTIDGQVDGTIQSFGRLTLGRNAHVRGDIQTRSVTVHGTVDGNLSVDEQCELRSGCTLRGDIETSRLIVDEDVNFTGNAAIATRDLLSELRPPKRDENGNGHNPA